MSRQLKFIDLFAGIGGFHLALKSIGMKCVFTSEIDKYARQTYEANFKDKYLKDPNLFTGDIWKVDYKNIGLLKKYTSENGKILPSRVTSVSLKKQRELSLSIKRARNLALI